MLKLHNTLTRTKEEFVPLDAANVRMYVCGPTVYDYAHIGNARPVIVFDVLFRLLQYLAKQGVWDGGRGETHVTYVRNITDVDDKINARAAEEYPGLPLNEAIRAVTEKTERQFHADVDALGCLRPTFEPRATEFISAPDRPEDMVRLIARLIERGHAYVAEGHVLFDVPSMPDYGRLSNRTLDEMVAGARVDVAPYKRDPMDFVLWKPSKSGEPAWPSPWGDGRPGWHIECSAMAGALLGQTFDIHGGGIDLIFPHHENEIAQSRCAHGTPLMARTWMHNGFLQVEGEKMSKSLGNFVTIHELLSGWRGRIWPAAAVRWAMLQTRYSEPINWTFELLAAAAKEIGQSINVIRGWYRIGGLVDFNNLLLDLRSIGPSQELIDALSDDLNTAEASAVIRHRRNLGKEAALQMGADLSFLGVISDRTIQNLGDFHGVASDIEDKQMALQLATDLQSAFANNTPEIINSVHHAISLAGLKEQYIEPYQLVISRIGSKIGDETAFSAQVRAMKEARDAARKAKNFAEADRIRAELEAMGIVLKDGRNPATGEIETTWEIKR